MEYSIIQSVITSSINVSMLCFLLYILVKNSFLSKSQLTFYILSILSTVLVIAAECITLLMEDIPNPSFRVINIMANIVGFSLSTAIPILLAIVLDETLLKKKIVIWLPVILVGLLCIVTLWTGSLFFVTADNHYRRGPLFFIYIICYGYSILILAYGNIKKGILYEKNEQIYLSVLFFIMLAGITVQVLFPFIHTTWHCVTFCLILYYIFQREIQFEYDELTGLLNRTAFEKKINSIIHKHDALIIVFDITQFKMINDTYGHLMGDECIHLVGKNIKECFKKLGKSYRIGGDEFCLIGHVTEESILPEYFQELDNKMAAISQEKKMTLHIDYGYKIYDKNSCEDIRQVFSMADQQMYVYKSKYKKHCE